MSVNAMNFEDASTLLTSLTQQVTGDASISVTDESDFVSVATTLLQTGYDPIAVGISQIEGKTIFSDRRYTQHLRGLQRNSQEWGGVVRKVNYLDNDVEQSKVYDLTDGSSVDPWKINKTHTLQTNYYGGNSYTRSYTITEDQLKTAFRGSAEFGSYWSGQNTHIANMVDQLQETESRACLNNLIAGKIDGDPTNVIHLLTVYKAQTGNTTITSSNYLSDDEFVPFAKWLYGYMNTLIDMMGERSIKYHMNVTTYMGASVDPLKRFTPRSRMKCYMHNFFMNQINSSVLSSVFHNDLLRMVDYESINYWQSIDDPMAIKITPAIMLADGSYDKGNDVEEDLIVGVLFDEEACGITRILEGTAPSPFNPRGRYYTVWMNWITRWYNDFTENAIVLMLD